MFNVKIENKITCKTKNYNFSTECSVKLEKQATPELIKDKVLVSDSIFKVIKYGNLLYLLMKMTEYLSNFIL